MVTRHGNAPRGMDLIGHQGLDKGTAFTDAELAALGLHGILPRGRTPGAAGI